MLDIIRKYRDRMRCQMEIECIDNHVLDDLGVSRAGLRRISLTPGTILQRLAAMARRQQVDRSAVFGDLRTLPRLLETCSNCRQTRACATFLAEPSVEAHAATFCPNLSEFRRRAGRPPAC